MTESATPNNLHATTIDEVIASLDKIVDWSITNNKRTGYFAALYRNVTINVKKGIEQGKFDDGPRMERLDVIFANRYLDAFEDYLHGQPVTESWRVAFEQTERWFPLVLQHLMVGMNAHINLDLGIAAAQTVAEDQLDDLKPDFERINTLLIDMIDGVEKDLDEIWPMFGLLDVLAGSLDEKLAAEGMEFARNQAWQFALKYAKSDNKEQTLRGMDQKIHFLGKALMSAGWLNRTLFFIVRILERGNVAWKINALTT